MSLKYNSLNLKPNDKPLNLKRLCQTKTPIHSFTHSLILSLTLLLIVLLPACEERFQPELTTSSPQLVIEGHIEVTESAEIPLPPYVILTRTIPFYSTITVEDIENLFVHDAVVEVSNGNEKVRLEEVCWEDVPEELQSIVIETVPGLGDLTINYCIYTDLSFSFFAEKGKTYDLYVETDQEIARASTMIPEHVPVDSLFFIPAAGGFGDSLLEMHVVMTDPALTDDHYRYFTSTNGGPFNPGFNSVFNDKLFPGQNIEFPLPKGEPQFREDNAEIFGLYRPGDEVIVRWANIDEAHYNFWNSLEFNRVNQGPFGSYTQVQTNVEGGLGIWGGYSTSHYQLVAE